MNVLLDTHTFLWGILDDPQMSVRARDVIGDGTHDVFLSAASAWEIAIKARLGRIRLSEDPERLIPDQVSANGFRLLPIHLRHALKVHALPDVHGDPFDRMLVAQAMVEDMALLSADSHLTRYPVTVLW